MGTELVKEIQHIIKLHNDIVDSAKNTIAMVIEIGEDLVRVKEELPHGSFTAWIDQNMPFKIRTAQNYMRVYLNNDEVGEVEDLSTAYALLENKTPPKQKEQPIYEPVDIGPVLYFYEKDLRNLVSAMDRTYDKLSSNRDHTTPIALSNMIGNIKDMSDRLKTWLPGNIDTCPKCLGSGEINGIACDLCINGELGIYKESIY